MSPAEPAAPPSGPAASPAADGAVPPPADQTLSAGSDAVRTGPTAKTPGKTPPSDETVLLSDMLDDSTLEKEIAAALGDTSLMELYDASEVKAPRDRLQPPAESPAPGVVRGRIVGINGDDIFIDLGGKSQGLLQRGELEDGDTPEIGGLLDVAIVGYDRADGLILLSKKTAEQQLLIRDLKKGALVEARVVASNKGGLEMDIKGLKAFMPASQISMDRIEELDSLIGQQFTCAVIDVERGDRNIVLSRRRVLEKERHEKQELLWADLAKGQTRTGTVSRLADFGAFIDLGGADGLLHVSEMSWARVNHPKEILQVGQQIDVVVLEVDKDKQRISLSLKMAGGDPWKDAGQKYAPGTRHQAQVTHLQDFGAFAELEPGLEGLIPISEMTWAGRIRHPKDMVRPGTKVEVEVLNLDIDKRRISLSMKKLQGNPWLNIHQKYVRNETYTGTVARLTDFGAFVTLEEGVDGLVHISELADKHVQKAADVVKVGEEVTVRVLRVDPDQQRIALSMKGFSGEPAPEAGAPDAAAPPTSVKKKDRPRRGGLSWGQDDKDSGGGLGLKL
ncbi:MAG: S1 RNA-binding domain-containing protein [Sedimentisphaerales bacterium]|nr:S1 RNA-binding domain-containing protein [Sedimentisphaerales bacterium]